MASTEGVQRTYAPTSICYGCGPANPHGLQIDSYREGMPWWLCFDQKRITTPSLAWSTGASSGPCSIVMATGRPRLGSWTQAATDEIPCTVTASYTVRLLRPTPMDTDLRVTARVTKIEGRKAWVDMALEADGKRCAEGDGLFVAVKEGHPAYHRWS